MSSDILGAASHGKASELRYFLSKGSSPDVLDRNGRSTLWISAGQGKHELVDILLGAGADDSLIDKAGLTPLLIACWSENFECAKSLAGRGQDQASSPDGHTPLMLAARHGESSIANFMISLGSTDLEARDINGSTACFWLARPAMPRLQSP